MLFVYAFEQLSHILLCCVCFLNFVKLTIPMWQSAYFALEPHQFNNCYVARWLSRYMASIYIYFYGNYMTLIYGLYSYVWFFLSFLSFFNIKFEMPVNIRSSLLYRMINIHKPSCNASLCIKRENRWHI